MKQIKNYAAQKYKGAKYSPVEDGIYRVETDGGVLYVTSLSFVQEPELDEGSHANEISQYPLEDVLDEFWCHISDFYVDLNIEQSQICCQEFASPSPEDVRKLRTIIGKHIYNKEVENYIKLIIE